MGLFSQISLILLSVAIVFTYITPTLDEIRQTQDAIGIYRTELAKISEVNQKLNQVASKINSISSDDQRKLLMYMPDNVDTIAVPRDIEIIADNNGLLLNQIEYVGVEERGDSTFVEPSMFGTTTPILVDPEAHIFSVEFEASYDQIKQFLRDIEQNAYPLEVHELSIEQTEGGFLLARVKIVTYDRTAPPPLVDPSLVVPPGITS